MEVRTYLNTTAEEMTIFPTPDVRIVRKIYSGNVTKIVGMIHRDGLGSVRAITSDNGLRNETDLYRPFGEQAEVVQSLGAVREAKGYIGERYDADAGLQYLNARYYDPRLGMFVQPDWWEVTQAGVGTNRFAYSFNDPINGKDPLGHACNGLNVGSGYCNRASLYHAMDSIISAQYGTNYFEALAITVELYGSTEIAPFGIGDGMSSAVSKAMKGISEELLKHNIDVFSKVRSGEISLTGRALDEDLLMREQIALQAALDNISKVNPDLYRDIVSEMNGNLNDPSALSGVFKSDGEFMDIIEELRDDLGRDLDFSSLDDRLEIGRRLLEHADEVKSRRPEGWSGCDDAGCSWNEPDEDEEAEAD